MVPCHLLSESHVPHVNFCAGISVNKQGELHYDAQGLMIVL